MSSPLANPPVARLINNINRKLLRRRVMANRFPLIVNPVSKKIEELISGDNLDLTGNGLLANNTLGTSGQYLKTIGTTIIWDNPGDVYLTTTQTLETKP